MELKEDYVTLNVVMLSYYSLRNSYFNIQIGQESTKSKTLIEGSVSSNKLNLPL